MIIGFVIMSLFESESVGPKMTNRYLMKKICNKDIGTSEEEPLTSDTDEKELIKE